MTEEEKRNMEELESGKPDFNGEGFLAQDDWIGVDVHPYRLDFTKAYTPPEYLLSWNGIGFAPLGGIHAVTGQAGNGKTMAQSQFVAAILGGEFGSLRYELEETHPEPKVLYIDTEMEEANTIAMKNRVLTMTGRDVGQEYDDFIILMLREVTSLDKRTPAAVVRWRMVLKALYEYRPTVCFIDGLIDVVADFNDNIQCQDLIYKCMQAASHYHISLWCLIHQNPGGEKLVGHLGSFIERKVTDIFEVKKEKNQQTGEPTFTVRHKKARGRDIGDWQFKVLPVAGWGLPEQVEKQPMESDSPSDIKKWLSDGQLDISWPASLNEIKSIFKLRGGQKNTTKLQADIIVAKNRRFIIEQSKETRTKGQKPKFILNPEEFDLITADENECPF